ncbi:MAG: S16 family serine protease [Nanoarchaeota archaeon]|nr:hypothetical protein [Nanoarchaeota archaeon]MBU4300307.1 hypothetical protein [Nanoarchaeota archaeon]MBU4452046.1 hypothetical protein [Nanoarchaeota archaeon]MCG2723185.1 hypothetical protein [archaeon]
MIEKKNIKNRKLIVLLMLAVLAASAIIIYSYKTISKIDNIHDDGGITLYPPQRIFKGDYQSTTLKLPAVNTNNTGVSAYLIVAARKGTGNVFLDVNSVLSKEDTQHSVRLAAEFAKEHENISSGSVDLFYGIKALAPVLEGPSAGAAFAVATIATLRNESPAEDVMLTGTLNHDGSIGPSGKILEKAIAAKEAGAKIFLVPVGSLANLAANYTESEYCKMWGDYEYCYPEFKPQIINASKEAGIPIIEIATMDDALAYFRL